LVVIAKNATTLFKITKENFKTICIAALDHFVNGTKMVKIGSESFTYSNFKIQKRFFAKSSAFHYFSQKIYLLSANYLTNLWGIQKTTNKLIKSKI
jgi:hypothetical protein